MWLIDEEVGRSLASARQKGLAPSAEHVRAFDEAQAASRGGGDPRNMTRAGNSVEIRVDGVLTKKPDFFAMFFGGGNTTYESVAQALAIAANDPTVKEAVLYVDSPGGQVEGLFDALAAIESFRHDSGKKLRVVAAKAQSAAYAIASLAGPIQATSIGSMFGSIGTAIDYLKDDSVASITNTDSPDKRPDLSTEEGRAVVVQFLDAVNELFVDAIARGRGTTSKDVTENFGRGATFVASEAKRRGMIDALPKVQRAPKSAKAEATPSSVGNHTENNMDLKELKAQHPDTYDAAVAEGVKQERDRACAHLEMGEQSGDIKTAHEAIRAGESMTLTLTAKYMAAGMNRADRKARQADSDAVGAAIDGAKSVEAVSDIGASVCDILEQRRGGNHA